MFTANNNNNEMITSTTTATGDNVVSTSYIKASSSSTTNNMMNIENFSINDIMSAASQFTDNAFSFSESSTYSTASAAASCSTPNNKKRKMSSRASFEDELVNQDGESYDLSVSTKKCKIEETFTASLSPTKKKLPVFRLSEKKTQQAFNVDPMSADTSSMFGLKDNMLGCFSCIDQIVSDLNSDVFGGSFDSIVPFTQVDLDQTLSLLNH